jgi:uncharacterized protein (UPF0261 family)
MCSRKTVALVSTLDTKGEEVDFLRKLILTRGHNVLVIDTGVLGCPATQADISSQEVAREGGVDLAILRDNRSEAFAQQIMAQGLTKITCSLMKEGRIHAMLAIGGGQGSTIAASALKALPLGFPKLLVSTKAVQAGIRAYVGSKDVMILPSVADLAGINRLTSKVLANAAGAVAGMLEASAPQVPDRPLVVMSMNGTITDCGLAVKGLLEAEGYEVLVFHTIGTGGEALEDFLAHNEVTGVIELGVNEIGNELFGGLASAGPHRLETAVRRGFPMVVVPGSADFINFLGPETVPGRFRNRRVHYHNPKATCVRTSANENRKLGRAIAAKLNLSFVPTVVLWPGKGLSSWSCSGQPFHDPKVDLNLLGSLKRHLKSHVPLKEFDLSINDPDFAEVIFATFLKIVSETERQNL